MLNQNGVKLNNYKSNKRIVIFTAIMGGYEIPKCPVYIDGVDYVLFTDDKTITSDIWRIIHLDRPMDVSPAIFYKLLKCQPQYYLPEYDYCIWIDGHFEIRKEWFVDYLLTKLKSDKLLVYKHSSELNQYRNCISTEAVEGVERCTKYGSESLYDQVNDYFNDGFPREYGLFQSGIILYNNRDDDVIRFCEEWYHQISKYGVKVPLCQISLPYALWKSEVIYDVNNDTIWDRSLFRITDHGIR